MSTLIVELKKEKRTGIIPMLCMVGILGAMYIFANFILRKDSLLNLPMNSMDILLTQLYGVIMILNMFGIVVATAIIYYIEFNGNAIQKMYILPIRISGIYFCKFIILTVVFFVAIVLQNISLFIIGVAELPQGAFEIGIWIRFAGYSFITSMPVLAIMLFVSSRFQNIWVPLGIGVGGFLSGMALGTVKSKLFLINPFVVMIKPAVSMSSQPETIVGIIALVETLFFLFLGLLRGKQIAYE